MAMGGRVTGASNAYQIFALSNRVKKELENGE
jgi:hypothetical protein